MESQENDPLDYETPEPARVRTSRWESFSFWLTFVVASFVGLAVSNIFDDIFEQIYLGRHADGELLPACALGIPVGAITAFITRKIRGSARTRWGNALTFGFLAPQIVLIIIIISWIIYHLF
jgi:H+/Cl- antiporter ClcA